MEPAKLVALALCSFLPVSGWSWPGQCPLSLPTISLLHGHHTHFLALQFWLFTLSCHNNPILNKAEGTRRRIGFRVVDPQDHHASQYIQILIHKAPIPYAIIRERDYEILAR